MTDNSIRKILELNEAAEASRLLRGSDTISVKLAEQAREAMRLSESHSAVRDLAPHHSVLREFAERDRHVRELALEFARPLAQLTYMEDVRRARMIPRLAIGPLAEMREAEIFSAQQLALESSLAASSRMLESFEAAFKLPSLIEVARLAAESQHSTIARALASVTEPPSVLAAMGQMKVPWVDTANPLVSGASFAAIQEIANAVRVAPAFDVEVASALRLELGDWREPIVWPKEIFGDLQARSNFYANLGVNPALTTMPATAFRETLEVAGLIDPSGAVDEHNEEDVDSDESAFGRTNDAHDKLQRLEVELRRFIEAVLSTEYGPQWTKRAVPGPTLDDWKDKQEKARCHTDVPHTLISYADFTDYERIICRRDNWKHFEPFFGRRESVLESLQRLYPIRVDTMHARMITQDDELFLLVEYKRLTCAMRKLQAKKKN